MITISVTKSPWDDHEFTTSASFTIGEDARTSDAIRAFVNALVLETYGLESIRASLLAISEELAEEISAYNRIMQERS